MRSTLTLALLFCLAATQAHAATPKEDIGKVVDAFQKAIITHDGKGLEAMFLPKGGAWIDVMDDASFAIIKAQKPDAMRMHTADYKPFCDFVGSTDKRIEEKFSNVRIEADDNVGMVFFDYVFLMEGQPTNHGVETWQMVRTDGGWKIGSMMYSVSLDKPKK
ncbi:hypothetical protein FHW69_002328 [Luteibacter sp. Sphag1AF]|uniref:nuclear transport factor 2 family protein n=1 Tax=Luteibacter sp. Sphag1AF TaxID=2587031 RepID=UPI00161765D4|nr:nuclear transport factor 2 family protein [Luteibacter sp. Sphag1AF]MBB3227705.1 hypothetical protein [Luteibacter sp. Sphag1AF]